MPYMDCIEVWKAFCECGDHIVFPVEESRGSDDHYKCKCGIDYVIDRAAGHYHETKEQGTVELINDEAGQ